MHRRILMYTAFPRDLYSAECHIIIMFDLVCDRLCSPSDLVKSWGECDGRMQGTSAGIGLTGHSIILYMSSGGTRSSHSAVSAKCIHMAGNLGINTAVGDRMVT